MVEEQKQDMPDDALAAQGLQNIRWAEIHQRLLQRIRVQFKETKPFEGLTIGMCLQYGKPMSNDDTHSTDFAGEPDRANCGAPYP